MFGINTRATKAPHTGGFTLIELLVVIAIIALLAAILFPVFARARENARKSSCSNNVKQIMLGVAQYTQDYDETYPTGWGGPGNVTWHRKIFPYVKSTQGFLCPSESGPTLAFGSATPGYVDPFVTTYAANTAFISPDNTGQPALNMADLVRPSNTIFLCDSGLTTTGAAAPYIAANAAKKKGAWLLVPSDGPNASNSGNGDWCGPNDRHLETANIGFADGHVKSMKNSAWYFNTALSNYMKPSVGGP